MSPLAIPVGLIGAGSGAIKEDAVVELIDDLKAQARVLHRRAQAGDPAALARLGQRSADEPVLRRHCLAALAKELGFSGWPHAVSVLEGAEECADFGTMLVPPGASAHWNIWSATYEEAREIHRQAGGFLLAYRRHYFIADRYFVEMLGLDPDDDDWAKIGHDWARPADVAARRRLYAQLIGSTIGTATR